MKFNCLIPELSVFDLKKSINFYTEVLGFEIKYSKPGFAMIVLNKCQIMLKQLTLPSSNESWNVTDGMKCPLVRDVNFLIILPNISMLYNSLKQHNNKIFIDLLIRDYQENNITNHALEFLVQDPNGYLLRFQQDISEWHFGDNKKMADELFNLVLKGDKTATSYIYNKNEKLNKGFSVLTNWDKTKKILIETTKIYKTTFDKVTEEHAVKEGEKDKTLKSWKTIHQQFFTKELNLNNLIFDNTCEIVCEEFRIIKRWGKNE